MRLMIALAIAALTSASQTTVAQEQLVDPAFVVTVEHPAYEADGPRVTIDEAHGNFHTASGQYAPFAALLRADGYQVQPGAAAFDAATLAQTDVLVIANAGSPHGADTRTPAFTETEIEAVDAWVRGGGALLLVADHAPFGLVAEALATRFGVGFGKGWVFERNGEGGLTTQIMYSRENGGLGDHPVTTGRTPDEAVALVRSFTGQSLVGPPGAMVLLRIPAEAWEAPDRAQLDASDAALRAAAGGAPVLPEGVGPVGGRAQGLAFTHGAGRVVVLGEAGMLSAQLIRFRPAVDRPDMRVGMNFEGIDNRQFALNLLHWLSGATP
jgi:hypothetical protein